MQDYVEMPTVDLTAIDYCDLDKFIYIISEVCELLAKDNYVTIKIIKKENEK